MITETIESRFSKSVAIIIGINQYENGVPPLNTATNDASRLANTLKEQHNFEVRLFLDQDASKQTLTKLLKDQLPEELGPEDRLIFYFAGHGVALDGDDGPNGYLLPQDARRGEEDSYLFMPFVHDALLSLPVRHALIIMDSCFSGAFRWAATRDLIGLPAVIHEERFDRFVKDPAWQVITSTAHDQKAMDQLSSGSLGTRPDELGHSPFALALFEALEGKADVVPAAGGDGLITATELYLYLESRLQPETIDEGIRQTPGLWPLSRHDKGEFVFAVPGRRLDLPPAPPLNMANNPYRGLESYDKQHSELFFGRDEVIADLEKRIESQALTVVLGASGTGKSSLIKAGLLPKLEMQDDLLVLPTIRPGAHPLLSISRVLDTEPNDNAIELKISKLCDANSKTVLFIDQFDELITMTASADEREKTLQLLSRLLNRFADKLDIIITLRTDFEPQFSKGELNKFWKEGRFVVPPMNQNELRECILKPATARVMYFKPNELVDELINEVVATPGALPLLSFALSEMYIHYLGRNSDERAIERVDYELVGGVVGALRSRANAEYDALEDDEHKRVMRLIMLRMVAEGKGNIARRRVLRTELVYESEARNVIVNNVINGLVRARLVVTGNESFGDKNSDCEDYVEPAHDALVRAWGRLLRWVHKENERDPDDLRFQRKLTADAQSWEQSEVKSEKQGLLWNDAARSASIKTLLKSSPTWLNRREHQFSIKSVLARRRFRQLRTAGMLVVVVLAVVAIWQAEIAMEQGKRAVMRGLSTEIRAGLAEGNLYRSLQIAQRSEQTFDSSPEMAEAMGAISSYNSPQLAQFRMPSNVRALFGKEDGSIIAYYSPDQRLDNYPFDVIALNWNGKRTEITSGATSVRLSHNGNWITATSYNEVDSAEVQNMGLNCELTYSADIFDVSDFSSVRKPRLSEFPASDYVYPKIGDQDSALAIACGTKVFSVDIDDIPADSPWKPVGGFDTGGLVQNIFFESNGQLVVVHANSTSVYTRAGGLVLQIKGEASAASSGGLFVTVLDWLTKPTILVYDLTGRPIAEFEGIDPVLSQDGRRLAFKNVGGVKGSTVVNFESMDAIDEELSLRNGSKASIRTFNGRYQVDGRSPQFSEDGKLLMTLHGGGQNGKNAENTWLMDSASGRRLFVVEGEGIAFARNRPVLMTVNGANIHLWDVRRFSTKVPMKWDDSWPAIDLEAFVAMHPDGESECDEFADACLSIDGKTKVEKKYHYLEDTPDDSFEEYTVTREPAQLLPEPSYFAPDLKSEFNCQQARGVRFSHIKPWLLLACSNGLKLAHLNGDILQSWEVCKNESKDSCPELNEAYFSDDGKSIFDIRTDRRVYVHTPGQPQSESLILGVHEAFISAVDRHISGLIAVATGNGTIQVYNAEGEPIQKVFIDVDDAPIRQLRFSTDGRVLFARDYHNVIHQWIISSKFQLEMYQWIDAISDEDWNQLISN